MPGFRRSQTTTESLVCSQAGCAEKARDMCLEHMSAFCAKHLKAHVDGIHRGKVPSGSAKKKA